MGLFNDIFRGDNSSKESEQAKRRKSLRHRICRIEEVESRELLSASPYEVPDPINVGIVYHEDYTSNFGDQLADKNGDTFIISWNGGAAGTTLDSVVIDLNKDSAQKNSANIHFNIDGSIPNKYGTYQDFIYASLKENEGNGITATAVVSEDGKTLTILFENFTSDKQFFFKIDVDEVQGEESPKVDVLVSGSEMEGAKFSGTFSSPHYAQATFTMKLIDAYTINPNTNLRLPSDDYGMSDAANTAGRADTIGIQIPLAGSLSGHVYEDKNNDGLFQPGAGEKGIAGVWLELYYLDTAKNQYVSTGQKVQTDENGFYIFENVAGGRTYKIIETQPNGWLDGKDTPGYIGTDQVGRAVPNDEIDSIHLGAEEHGVQYNFGELKPVSISGYVFHDRDNDGNRDAGEEGIGGVKLYLYELVDGLYVPVYNGTNPVWTTTAANGSYSFDNLNPYKTYQIREEQPTDWVDGKDSVGTIGGIRIGVAEQNDRLSDIEMQYGQNGVEYNFGEYKKGSISGYVYEDDDNDGTKDPGEKGVKGVTIYLCVVDQYGNKTNIAQTVTDENGYYSFGDLEPGKIYCVTEEDPAGYCDGKVSPGTINGQTRGEINTDVPADHDQIHNINLNSGESGINYNFAENTRGKLSGYVYLDANEDGVRNSGDTGIKGVVLTLWVWDGSKYVQTSKTATTDDNGYYEFLGLCPFKRYRITETQPSGYLDGEETIGNINGTTVGTLPGNDIISDIDLPAGGIGNDYNFGELAMSPSNGSLSGTVYVDTNKNGKRDGNEPGIAGVKLTLWRLVDGVYLDTGLSTTTDANGNYRFDNLPTNETYMIAEEQPAQYDDGEETIGSLGGQLISNDQIGGILVRPGNAGTGYDFGELEKPPVVHPGSVSGYVYVDANKNGVRDANEIGIEGVTLTLWKKVGGVYQNTGRTVLTNASGYYIFDNLEPGYDYQVRETQPGEYDDGEETVGSLGGNKSVNDVISDIKVGDNQHGTNYNFGELVKTDPSKGSLSGYVYVDKNGNGAKDSGEAGIKGVKLTLYKLVGDEYVATGLTATTDANGYYVFSNLDPLETYMIVETQPDGYDDGEETVGSLGGDKSENDKIKGIYVTAGDKGTEYNFGELEKPPVVVPGSISGYVYHDANSDGVKNAGESGIAGVVLYLYEWDGSEYVYTGRWTATDSNGYYIFDKLDPGKYQVHEVQPAGYLDGRETVGSLGGDASENDRIKEIVIASGSVGVNYNFGELLNRETPPPTPPPPIVPPHLGTGAVGQPGGFAAPTWQTPIIGDSLQAGYGGGGIPAGVSFHLSVVNGGHPRSLDAANSQSLVAARSMLLDESTNDADLKTKYVSVAWTPLPMNQMVWYVRNKDGSISKKFLFGPNGGRPILADFNGDGIAEVAVYHEGKWYIDLNGNGVWDEEDLYCELGSAADQPIVGDWDGDGKADIGIFGPQWAGDEAIIANEAGLPSDLNQTLGARPKNIPDVGINSTRTNVRAMKHAKTGQVRLDVIDHVFQYGGEGDQAISGDFTGDGITKVGVYRNGNWYIDYNGNGVWDPENGDIFIEGAKQGLPEGGIAVVGDWDGDGIDNIGLFVNGVWHLDTKGNFQFDTTVKFGEAGDLPVVGDFNGDGISQLAVVRPSHLDSLQAKAMPSRAPASSLSDSAPQYASNKRSDFGPSQAEGGQKVASQYNDSDSNGQGVLPEELQRHERTMRTPHTNIPLKQGHRSR